MSNIQLSYQQRFEQGKAYCKLIDLSLVAGLPERVVEKGMRQLCRRYKVDYSRAKDAMDEHLRAKNWEILKDTVLTRAREAEVDHQEEIQNKTRMKREMRGDWAEIVTPFDKDRMKLLGKEASHRRREYSETIAHRTKFDKHPVSKEVTPLPHGDQSCSSAGCADKVCTTYN